MLSLLRRIWRAIPQYHADLYFSLVVIILTNVLGFVAPYILKLLIDGLGRAIPLRDALVLAGFAIVGQMSNTVAQAVLEFRTSQTLLSVELSLKERAFAKLLSLSLAYHERETTGRKTARMVRGADAVDRILSTLLWNAVPTVVNLTLTFFVLLHEAPALAYAFLAGVPLSLLVSLHLDTVSAPYRKEINDGFEHANDIATQSLLHVLTVQSFSREGRTLGAFRRVQDTIAAAFRGDLWVYLRWDSVRMLLQDGAFAAFMFLGVVGVLQGRFTVGTFIFVVTIALRALERLFSITHVTKQLREGREPAERLLTLDEEDSDVRDAPDAFIPERIDGAIRLRDVTFTYPTASTPALEDVSLDIAPGEQAAVIGPSGGGKSTLVKLLFRHYDASSGVVEIDGRDIREYARDALRTHMGLVPQDVEVFDGTVRENIAYADPDASLERVEAAARMANAHEFIMELAKGYDAEIGERGIKLSGGQRQRVGIARALLRDPAILVFDEATSHLDSESERLIHDALEKIRGKCTLIVIAHRLSTIRLSDKIFVLEKGRIVESGDHQSLLQQGGLYRKLTQLQSLGDVIT